MSTKSPSEESYLLDWYIRMGVTYISTSNNKFSRRDFMHEELTIDLDNPVQLANKLAKESKTIAELKKAVQSFEGCSLKQTAINTVFIDGVEESDVVLVGEAPGATEDAQGIPFCGESGKLLNTALQAIGLNRQENYLITNSVFWRPPANRRPTVQEIAICRPFVQRLLEIISPKLLILVGATAVESILGLKTPMGSLRQRLHSYPPMPNLKVTAVFHPAYLLRQPLQKRELWQDLLFIQQILENN